MSPLTLPQLQSDHASIEGSRDASPPKSLFKRPCPESLSLNRMIMNPSVFSAAHSALTRDYAHQLDKPKTICFDDIDYGYGDADEAVEQRSPSSKKRRYERRNSKTPAMLMAMNAALDLDFLEEHDNVEKESSSEHDAWDGGLAIAEELVKQIQSRQRSNSTSSSTTGQSHL